MDKRILVLGVGNLLYTDEGLGVRVAETLEQTYQFSDNVTVLDGGTLGNRLIGPILECDYLIVADAVLGDGEPGTVYRLTGDDLRNSLAFKDSMHQTDLVDVLVQCGIVGNRPDAVIIGMEPADYQTMATELSGPASENLPTMIEKVLEEITSAGGSFAARTEASTEKIYVPRGTV